MDRNFINSHRDWINDYMENKKRKYSKDIECTRTNFIFLKSGSMIYPYRYFDSYLEAMVDAIEQGEDIDDIVSLVFHETIDQLIVKQKLQKILNKTNS